MHIPYETISRMEEDFTCAGGKTPNNFLEYKSARNARYLNSKKKGYYVWRTVGDNKVRSRHAKLNGKVFNWDDIPPGGLHPGEDYGCRCKAVPIDDELAYDRLGKHEEIVNEFAKQKIASSLNEGKYKWTSWDFAHQAFTGGGSPITLRATGHLKGIINYYFKTLGIEDRIIGQIADAARKSKLSNFTYTFNRPYDFEGYLFAIGDATISGAFNGIAVRGPGFIEIEGSIKYKYFDIHTDPADLREIFNGTSDVNEVSEDWRYVSDGGGIPYSITDEWETEFNAKINEERSKSKYKWEG